ncbi:MAG: 1-deoxy-D-xylulose-5-phosphate reductoisomerase [Candidatus Omnitrophica bacterium]|nr:1-deoxy-D-xylulose-5-phosphate reductoisomerase [Candidatus Omnitrophota bacterium]
MKRNISILGSTGSVGVNTLRIVRTHPRRFSVKALAAKTNARRLYDQAREFKPECVCLYDEKNAAALEKKLRPLGIRLVTGDEGLAHVASLAGVNVAVFAVVGAVGLKPLFEAVKARKDVAIANKEPLVMAGSLLMAQARKNRVAVLPIDSEHSALWQCLEGYPKETVKRLILTSSGGPFRTRKGSLAAIKPSEALKHPNWKMGPKITIDSATLMNKGLEVIEAVNLFDVPLKEVDVLIHPESIIHSMIEFVDGSHLAHLGIADMRLPIQYALSYPERLVNHLPTLDLVKLKSLHFERPDKKRFPCLELGYEASRRGGTMPAVLNAANEIAVEAFLNHKIKFTAIAAIIEKTMARHRVKKQFDLQSVFEADVWARQQAIKLIR